MLNERFPARSRLVPALSFALALTMSCSAAVQRQELHSGWQFRAIGQSVGPEFQQWHAAKVPGVVQTDLLNNKLIPDPFYRSNEAGLQWIGLTDWEYTTHFNVDQATLGREHVELTFDGLDTF